MYKPIQVSFETLEPSPLPLGTLMVYMYGMRGTERKTSDVVFIQLIGWCPRMFRILPVIESVSNTSKTLIHGPFHQVVSGLVT